MNTQKDVPLYSSRITNTYLEYIQKFHPHVDVDEIMEYSGMKRYEVEDPGHWFTQKQVDRFYYKSVEMTGNLKIARDAGRFTASAERIGPIKQYSLGLMTLSTVYQMAEKLYSIMSKGAIAKAELLGSNKVEIIVTPKPTTKEKLYQCHNRIGTFESLAQLFAGKFSTINETECFHKGDKYCRYVIEWKKTPSLLLKLIRSYVIIAFLIAIPILFSIMPFTIWTNCILGMVTTVLILSIYSDQLERKELYKTIESQGNAAKELVNEINTRHNNALLIQEIGQVAAKSVHLDKLVESAMKIIMQYLFYDRGMILLYNPTADKLVFHTRIGFEDDIQAVLPDSEKDSSVSLDETISKQVITQQKPYLWNRIEATEEINIYGEPPCNAVQIQAIICVPIIYEKKCLGILIVETLEKQRQLTKSDMSLMIGIASQIAVGINNARSFQKLRNIKEQIQRSHDELEVRVADRTDELKELNRDLQAEIRERQNSERKLRSSIKEMNVLLKEVHHRVKNNLQVISSLFDMIKRRAKHPETIDYLNEAHAKVFTMSLIHSQLYQSDRLDEINMGKFIRSFVGQLAQFYPDGRNILLNIAAEDIYLSVTHAIPAALALNEIISNAFKHAFEGRDKGKISIKFEKSGDQNVHLLISDNGIGIPKQIDIDHTETLGIKLIRNLINIQLKGKMNIDCKYGTTIDIYFPINDE